MRLPGPAWHVAVPIDRRAESKSYFGWISPQAGVGQTRGANFFPINLVGDQLQKRPNIPATKSCVSLLYDIECCAHRSYLEGVLKARNGLTHMRNFATVST